MSNSRKVGGIAAPGHTAALVVSMILSLTLMFPLLDAALDQTITLDKTQIAKAEKLLAESEIGYWTWFENEQEHTSLNVTEVKALESPSTTRVKVRRVRRALQSLQQSFQWRYYPVTTLWIEKAAYDQSIEAGLPQG